MNLSRLLTWQTRQTTQIDRNDLKVVCESRALSVHFPYGGFVWNAPAAVIVQQDGRSERIVVQDRTRWVIWACMFLTVCAWLVSIIGKLSRKGRGV